MSVPIYPDTEQGVPAYGINCNIYVLALGQIMTIWKTTQLFQLFSIYNTDYTSSLIFNNNDILKHTNA